METFEKIRQIQIATTQLADDLLAGAYHSAFKGQGMEFEEVREYQAGDDVRNIDWNVTARMNHPYMKVFSEERELTVMLIVDVSSSSRFGSQNQLKRDLIAEVGAVIAFSAIKNNDKVGLILFSDEVEMYLPPKRGTRHVLRVIRDLLTFEPKHKGTNLNEALAFLGNVHRRTAICFLISDFLCDLPLHELSITSRHHDLIAINIADPAELDFPMMELTNIKDLETGEVGLVDSSSQTVKEKANQRREEYDRVMKKIGAGSIELMTNEPYIQPMQKFFKLREIRH